MAKTKGKAESKESKSEESDLDLTESVHTRISSQAKAMIRELAKKTGIKPMTMARQLIYRGLGIME